ncbi:ornithine decarboxylase [Caerostris extrusa]|uniref:Ornithine decarboxylase n=1 Tax=Caerostris extrusa TaxID=172846 RepID=A0AAV4WLZ0_CAEEX|nr:ornithine decarboxylase [Caerostris extrusa]
MPSEYSRSISWIKFYYHNSSMKPHVEEEIDRLCAMAKRELDIDLNKILSFALDFTESNQVALDNLMLGRKWRLFNKKRIIKNKTLQNTMLNRVTKQKYLLWGRKLWSKSDHNPSFRSERQTRPPSMAARTPLTRNSLKDASFLVFDSMEAEKKVKEWKGAMPRVNMFYAVKCNSDPVLLRTLAALNIGFDCASKNEIDAVINLEVLPQPHSVRQLLQGSLSSSTCCPIGSGLHGFRQQGGTTEDQTAVSMCTTTATNQDSGI